MNPLYPDMTIAIRVTDFNNRKEVIEIVRSHSNRSISYISNALKDQGNIFEIYLIRENFYRGWKNFYSLVNDLKSIDATIEILVNNDIVDLSFVEDLKNNINSINREDIY